MLVKSVLFYLTCAALQCGANPIKHLIVLMMGNRSFDHYLGWLKEENPLIDGLDGSEFQCSVPGPDDPGHGFEDTLQQIYGFNTSPTMDGFVWNAALRQHNLSNPMSMLTIEKSSAPVLNTLALEYAVFDHWFCSVPSSTDPNRAFAMSGTSNGMVTNYNGTLWSQQSYFDFLRERDVSWRAYYDQDVWAIGYFEDMNRLPNALNIQAMDRFYEDLQASDLPSFIWLQPSLLTHIESGPPNWQHPDASVQWGEVLIQKVYESLRDSEYWNSSALLITMDEHGGFYDHVSPPQNGVPSPDDVAAPNGFRFDRLGIRIPTVLVSPWVKKASVINRPIHGPYQTSQWESTSIMATANKLFGITDAVSKRESWAATFEYLFTETDEVRMDSPEFEAAKAFTKEDVMQQWIKPLNEHLKIQVKFYCQQLEIKECPTFKSQGDASLFISEMVPKYLKKIQNQ
eukprot:229123_1